MSYTKKIYRTKNGIDVEEMHTYRYPSPGAKREKKKKSTPEQMAKVNQKNKEKKCRRKLMQYFSEGDYFTCLTYQKENRPQDMKDAKKDFSDAMKVIRREYKKRGEQVRWIRNIEVGTRNAWHVHLVINRIQDTDLILRKAWSKGKVINQLLYERGGFRNLAAYITKTPQTDKRLRETSYSTSRNLPLPEPERKVYIRWKTWNKIRIPKGYYVDPDSVYEGINPITNYPYREYTLLKLKRRE
jgi:hypothetical protein